jgi:hypothetical protein
MLRCRALFQKYLSVLRPLNGQQGTEILAYPSSADEFELVFPEQWIVYASDSLPGADMFVPQFLARTAHTVYLTYKHWAAHLRVTAMSMQWLMKAREVGALVKGLIAGHLTLNSLLLDG